MQTTKIIGAIAAALLITSCGGGSGSKSKELISPADADSVTEALLVKVNGSTPATKEGNIPLATTSGGEPVISNLLEKVGVQNGQKVTLQAQVDSSSALALLFAKVTGANSYLEFDIAVSTKADGMLEIDITIPENITDGEFCQQFSAQDDTGRTSQPVEVCFEVESTADDPAPTPTPIPTLSPTEVLQALEGTWEFDCDVSQADDGSPESFLGSWAISSSEVTITESIWPADNCDGAPRSTYSESLTIEIGSSVTAADGDTAYNITITNLTEEARDDLIVRVDSNQFQLGDPGPLTFFKTFFKRNPQSAKACFNPVLLQTGTELALTTYLRAIDENTGEIEEETEFSETRLTQGPTTFDGRDVIEVSSSNGTTRYFQIDAGRSLIAIAGDRNAAGEIDRLLPALPAFDFNLLPGESYRVTIEETETNFNDTGELETTVESLDVQVTYIGRAQISTRAGTVQSCQFEYTFADGDGDGLVDGETPNLVQTSYVGIGSGIEFLYLEQNAQTREELYREEVISATITAAPSE